MSSSDDAVRDMALARVKVCHRECSREGGGVEKGKASRRGGRCTFESFISHVMNASPGRLEAAFLDKEASVKAAPLLASSCLLTLSPLVSIQ
jgi:hypothetical protein